MKRQNLSQAVSAAVLDRMRSGEFNPGDRLPTEKMLMEQYGVGRNAAREAMQALVTLGVIDVRPGRGATVLGIDSADAVDGELMSLLLKENAVQDLYAFRMLLETEIASCAAQVATPDEIAEIRSCVADFKRALERGAPVSDADDEIHRALARASHNSVYETVLDVVSGLIANARRLTSEVSWASERAAIEHERIVAAVAAHDAEAARSAMRDHIAGAAEAIEEGRRLRRRGRGRAVPAKRLGQHLAD